MFDELDTLIKSIQVEYDRISERWEIEYPDYAKLKLKKILVRDIYETPIMLAALDYRRFLNNEKLVFELSLNNWNENNSKVNTRVKEQNSIIFKIDNYSSRIEHEYGKTPVQKCLNDLYGLRIILDKVCTHDEIRSYISKKYPKLKCIDGSKQNYIATHVYFKKNNHSFWWELQIWLKNNERDNIASHRKYKQDYVRWEQQTKEVKK